MIRTLLTTLTFLSAALLAAQDQWPLEIPTEKGLLTIYQPQPESYEGNHMSARAAVQWKGNEPGAEPIFGAIWGEGTLEVDRDSRMATLSMLNVTDARFPSLTDPERLAEVKAFLSAEIPKHVAPFSIDRLIASLDDGKAEDANYSTAPPNILYRDRPSVLVLIDGDPIWEAMEDSGYERVVNSPFLLARKGKSNTLYLGSQSLWYTATDVKGLWTLTDKAPQDLQKLLAQAEEGQAVEKPETPPEVVVSTKPAELLQTEGKPELKTVEGLGILYVANSPNDILMDINGQAYYVLLSGRWYSAKSLEAGDWSYVSSEKLPADFARIPEGSDKDVVLASVAGTQAAREAVLDAQIPQTAKVDRNTKLEVQYDGQPKFAAIDGSEVEYAENSSVTVLRIKGKYYAVDNGVWFDAPAATGPWTVSTSSPKEVKDLPADAPVYNVKYVEVYDSTPDVVYVGYTPGYLGTYIYGPTVIYGTGYYYRPWYGSVYYPRPCTWGFNMHYNPWTGWSMGFTFNYGWFHFSSYGGYGCCGGWWGPPVYRPPYHPPYHGGYYGHRPGVGGGNTINIDNSTNINVGGRNNIYRDRQGVTPSRPAAADRLPGKETRPTDRPGQRPETKPATRPATKPNNVYTDREGNVYRRDKDNWQQYDVDGKWRDAGKAPATGGRDVQRPETRPADRPTERPSTRPAERPQTRPTSPPVQQLERQHNDRSRGQQRVNSYQQYQTRPQSRPQTRPQSRPTPSRAPSGGRATPTRRGR